MLSSFRCDYESAIEFADEGIKLCAAKNFGFLETALGWSRDCARIRMGVERDIEVPRRALIAYNERGTNLHMPVNYMVLAQCFGILGRPDLGLASVNQALPLIERTSQRNWEAETWRVKGDLLLQQQGIHPAPAADSSAAESEAERYIHKAIEIARGQRSKLFELRAVMSLARLLKRLGRVSEAQATLTKVYDWFTEGFDFVDLKEARALLQELSSTDEVHQIRDQL
jgi:tetratricopeptide (TPR) repeat protein